MLQRLFRSDAARRVVGQQLIDEVTELGIGNQLLRAEKQKRNSAGGMSMRAPPNSTARDSRVRSADLERFGTGNGVDRAGRACAFRPAQSTGAQMQQKISARSTAKRNIKDSACQVRSKPDHGIRACAVPAPYLELRSRLWLALRLLRSVLTLASLCSSSLSCVRADAVPLFQLRAVSVSAVVCLIYGATAGLVIESGNGLLRIRSMSAICSRSS